jgi:hypothetical protein
MSLVHQVRRNRHVVQRVEIVGQIVVVNLLLCELHDGAHSSARVFLTLLILILPICSDHSAHDVPPSELL